MSSDPKGRNGPGDHFELRTPRAQASGSPYILREAEKLRIGQYKPKIGAHADYDPRDLRFARTQREAGIEHLEWEERLPVIRPWMFFAISAACWIVLALGIAWMMASL